MGETTENEVQYAIGTKHSYQIKYCDHILDMVFGRIGLTEVERKLERLSIFKRLHSISQLGLVNWVFPCALHTRYTHSIGVMHIAGEMAMHINSNLGRPFFDDSDIEIIRIAGMLHDVGHYPMSHNVESAYKENKKKKEYDNSCVKDHLKYYTNCPDFLLPDYGPDDYNTKEKENAEEDFFKGIAGSDGFHHERIGANIIANNQDIARAIRENFVLIPDVGGVKVLNPKFAPTNLIGDTVSASQVDGIVHALMVGIGEMVRGNYSYEGYKEHPWFEKYSAMIQLIHSELDADNLDYLLRDATFSGTSYGTMDMGLLLNCLTATQLDFRKEDDKGDVILDEQRYIVGIRRKGLGCVEQFLLNKFLAYSQMIQSKYVSILEAMLLKMETSYVIPDEGIYTDTNLEKMTTEKDTSVLFLAFSDHYVFQKIFELETYSSALSSLALSIVSHLKHSSALNLCSADQSECMCTGFSKEEIREEILKSNVYQRFRKMIESLHEQLGAEVRNTKTELNLFSFRFEQYSLTKQIPIQTFLDNYLHEDKDERRTFNGHFYRLGNGIPVLDESASYSYADGQIPLLCVDCKQSSLHTLYSMRFVALREYQVDEFQEYA